MIKIVYNTINDQGPVSNVLISDDELFTYVNPYLHKMTEFSIARLEDIDHRSQSFLYELPWNSLTHLDAVYEKLDQKVIEAVKLYKGYFVINDSVDPAYSYNLETASNFFVAKGIPANKIIYLSGCVDIDSAKHYGINLVVSDWNETTISNVSDMFLTHEQFTMPKLKTFLSLNRTWHHHRLQFMYELYKHKLLDDFDISFLKTELHSNNTFAFSLYEKSLGFYPEDEIPNIEKLGKEIEDILPLSVDDVAALDGTHVSHSHIKNHSRYFYNVVTETTFYNFNGNTYEGIHLSEKILKPIMYKTPFILVGPVGSLKALHKLGYKTFSDFIDESYDNIEDPYQRMQAVVNLIKDISQMSTGKLAEIDILVRDICDYNFNHLVERGKTANARLSRVIKKIVYSI